MPKYQVQWKYSSGLGGPWQAGEEVELEEWRANHINVDSPGVLKPVEGERLKVESKKKQPATTGKSGKDRQVKVSNNRIMSRETPGYGQELLPDKDE